MGFSRRIYRMRPLSALLLSLPGLLLCAWYAWDAYAGLDRYRRAADRAFGLTLETFQIALHDSLRRDLRRLFLPSRPRSNKLPRHRFHIEGEPHDRLLAGAGMRNKRPYVEAKLERGRRVQPVRLHLRGQRHWHLLGVQKSLKVKAKKNAGLDGQAVLNLINDPTPMVIGEPLVMSLAREQGLLTPEVGFARVAINGADLGVYRRQSQADEGLLRANGRFPGDLYSGNLPAPGKAGEKSLWRDADAWRKVAWRQGHKRDRQAIERLVNALRDASSSEFAEYARNELDLQRFATLEALEIAFGIDQRDMRQNHKLYFDPYRGRFEPVVWSLRGFKHEPHFNLADHPLGLRLKYLPDYRALHNRRLYQLLVGSASPAAVRQRALRALKRLLPELASDPYWDAYKLLPRIDGFHRRMVRPMDARRLMLVFESEMSTYADRHRFLVRELERNPLHLVLGEPLTEDLWPLGLVVDGRAGVRLTSLEFDLSPGCERRFGLFHRGRPVAGTLHQGVFSLDPPLTLHSGLRLVQRDRPDQRRGAVRAVPSPIEYRFDLRTACRPRGVEASGVQLVTGSRIRSRLPGREPPKSVRRKALGPDQVPGFHSGEVAPHPGAFSQPAPARVVLGPGEVSVERTRVFGRRESVVVSEGTRLRMGPGASLIFLGPVSFEGRRESPIEVVPAGPAPFGGIALQGSGTAGSSLRHVVIRGGSTPRWRSVVFPATLSLHDTRRVRIEACRLEANREADDFLHAAYVDDLAVEGLTVLDAARDAVDLEFVRGNLRGLWIYDPQDECLDLMGAQIELADSLLTGAGGSALSAGERSTVRVLGSLLARSRIGVLAKNGSAVSLADSLVYRNRVGIRLERPSVYYPQVSRISAEDLFLVGSVQALEVKPADQTNLSLGHLQRRLPHGGALTHLRSDVLAIDSWDHLDAALARRPEAVWP